MTLEQQQEDGSVRPITFLSRVTLQNERNWTVLELEAGAIVWAIKRLRPNFFSMPFVIYSDHQALESLGKVGEHHPRVQRWLEFLNAYQFTLEYRKGSGNGSAGFLSRLPLPATESDIEGDCRLPHSDDVDVYFVGAPGYWPRVRSADSASDARVPIIPILDPSRGMDVRSPLPLMLPLKDYDFSDFRSHGPIMPIGAHPVPVLPVSPLPLAGRISQRTRSRTAAAQRLHHDVQHDDGEQPQVFAPSLNS